jgi:hypothetical protein
LIDKRPEADDIYVAKIQNRSLKIFEPRKGGAKQLIVVID